ITEGEIALIRTILNAFGGDSSIPVTEPEAEILMSVNRAVGARSAPPAAWTDLYAKAVANILLSEHGFAVPPCAVPLRPRATGDSHAAVDAPVSEGLGGLRATYQPVTAEGRGLARLERQRIEIVTGETVAGIDGEWLTLRLADSRRPSAV